MNEALKDTDKRSNPHMFETVEDRINGYNSLASFYLSASEYEQDQDNYDKMYAAGMNNINNADNLHNINTETWVTKSFFLMSQGNFKNAQ